MNDRPLAPAPPPTPPAKPQIPSQISGWRKALMVIGGVALVLRLLLALLMHHTAQDHTAATTAPIDAAATPIKPATWPPHVDGVLTFTPGDPIITKWGDGPNSDPFSIYREIPGGEPAVPNTVPCVFMPDFVADPGQPGGTLTIDGEDVLIGWHAHWVGGDTVPATPKKFKYDPNCGRDAELIFTPTQMHDLINIIAGLPAPPPEPPLPVGTELPIPRR